ncbi:Splicing factor 3A subunit 2 [Cichlidogyrus casuarinus]|uniref:Splicing factor 3A subunit 2 n=1 Tax=Cichlidogyrus casuarinus TaxID=1844966 RepID=A0ABD2PXB6_9PLAT
MDSSVRGGKTGTGGVASESETNRDRRERLRQLALETIDLAKDPYFMKNHLGTYECKLCLTLHNNEGSYLAHTQGKKHQYNLQKRAHEQAKDNPSSMQPEKARVEPKKFIKIGRPGYKVTKQKDPDTGQQSMLFQIDYPEIADANGITPKHRFMSAYEQKIEPPDRKWQYLLFAAEPYETIAFKVPSREVDKTPQKFWSFWNPLSKQFFLQFAFKLEGQSQASALLRDVEMQKARAQHAQIQLQLIPPHMDGQSETALQAPNLEEIIAGSDSENETTEYEEVLTPDQVIQRLYRVWQNELNAPVLLPPHAELLFLVMDELKRLEEKAKRQKSGLDISHNIQMYQIARFRFIITDYQRTRIRKIDQYHAHLLATRDSNMTATERQYALALHNKTRDSLQSQVLSKLPPNMQSMSEEKMIFKPNADAYVFCRANTHVSAIEVQDRKAEAIT